MLEWVDRWQELGIRPLLTVADLSFLSIVRQKVPGVDRSLADIGDPAIFDGCRLQLLVSNAGER